MGMYYPPPEGSTPFWTRDPIKNALPMDMPPDVPFLPPDPMRYIRRVLTRLFWLEVGMCLIGLACLVAIFLATWAMMGGPQP